MTAQSWRVAARPMDRGAPSLGRATIKREFRQGLVKPILVVSGIVSATRCCRPTCSKPSTPEIASTWTQPRVRMLVPINDRADETMRAHLRTISNRSHEKSPLGLLRLVVQTFPGYRERSCPTVMISSHLKEIVHPGSSPMLNPMQEQGYRMRIHKPAVYFLS